MDFMFWLSSLAMVSRHSARKGWMMRGSSWKEDAWSTLPLSAATIGDVWLTLLMESKHFLTTDSTSLGLSCTLIQSSSVTLKQDGLAASSKMALNPLLSLISLASRSPLGHLEESALAQSTESVDFSSSASSESFSGVELDFSMLSL